MISKSSLKKCCKQVRKSAAKGLNMHPQIHQKSFPREPTWEGISVQVPKWVPRAPRSPKMSWNWPQNPPKTIPLWTFLVANVLQFLTSMLKRAKRSGARPFSFRYPCLLLLALAHLCLCLILQVSCCLLLVHASAMLLPFLCLLLFVFACSYSL